MGEASWQLGQRAGPGGSRASCQALPPIGSPYSVTLFVVLSPFVRQPVRPALVCAYLAAFESPSDLVPSCRTGSEVCPRLGRVYVGPYPCGASGSRPCLLGTRSLWGAEPREARSKSIGSFSGRYRAGSLVPPPGRAEPRSVRARVFAGPATVAGGEQVPPAKVFVSTRTSPSFHCAVARSAPRLSFGPRFSAPVRSSSPRIVPCTASRQAQPFDVSVSAGPSVHPPGSATG